MGPRLRPASSPALRLFWALPLLASLRTDLDAWQRGQRVPGARWIPASNLHLTLAFLGSRPAAEVEAILAAGCAALAGRPPLELRTAELGAFPSRRAARVLWLGLQPSPDLAALAGALRLAMAPFGCAVEPEPFVPHLTLARYRHPAPLPELADFPPAGFAAAVVHLYASETRPEGPVYRCLGEAALSA